MLVHHPSSKSLPNLGRLSLTSIGVKVNPDGSALLTPGEWAAYCRLTATPPAPVPAPVPASTRRRQRLRNDDESSADERASPAPVPASTRRRQRESDDDESSADERASPAPVTASTRRRQRLRNDDESSADEDNDGMTLLKLSADELASILGGIGRTEQSKASACRAAQNLWGTSNPTVWRELAESIFKYDGSDHIFGEGLIYDTFSNNDSSRPLSPRSAFNNMCVAKGLANVLAKRFVAFGLRYHENKMLENWADEGSQITGLGEMFEELTREQHDELQLENYPDLAFTDDASNHAMDQFKNEPLKDLFLSKYKQDPIFTKLVGLIFQSTAKFLYADDNSNLPEYEMTTVEMSYMVGKVIGVYIVCLCELEHARENLVVKYVSAMEVDQVEELLDKMRSNSEILRSKLVSAVMKTAYQEDFNPEVDYSEFCDLPEELNGYETASDFGGSYEFDEPEWW